MFPISLCENRFALGEDCPALEEGRVVSVQCCGGTGALRAGAEVLARELGYDTYYLSSPTYGNYERIFHVSFEYLIPEYLYLSSLFSDCAVCAYCTQTTQSAHVE